jgi:hypothetical protein
MDRIGVGVGASQCNATATGRAGGRQEAAAGRPDTREVIVIRGGGGMWQLPSQSPLEEGAEGGSGAA